MNSRVLITGGAGLLGSELLSSAPPGADLHATWRHTPLARTSSGRGPGPRAPGDRPSRAVQAHRLDLSEVEATRPLVARLRPGLIIHTAYRKADGARDIIAATGAVASAARAAGSDLIHLSSDVVFDGEHAPYGEDDPLAPVSAYGRWKAEAEDAVRALVPGAAIIRTSLITRADPPDPPSAWVADSLRRGEPITLFLDELRCPIRVDDLAAQLWELATLARAARRGVWHLAGPEVLSRYALGVLIAMHQGLDPAGITPAASPRSAAGGGDLAPGMPEVRPRDLRLRTDRADAALRTPARPISTLFAPPGQPAPR